jgi:hypothetical protein
MVAEKGTYGGRSYKSPGASARPLPPFGRLREVESTKVDKLGTSVARCPLTALCLRS